MRVGFKGGRLRQGGFTIVELMITILILGILVMIVVMTMEVSKAQAQKAACKANLRTIAESITLYQSLHEGKVPPDLDTLVQVDIEAGQSAPYIKPSFSWTCPSGKYGTLSGDYRDYYNASTGETSCPRKDHNI